MVRAIFSVCRSRWMGQWLGLLTLHFSVPWYRLVGAVNLRVCIQKSNPANVETLPLAGRVHQTLVAL